MTYDLEFTIDYSKSLEKMIDLGKYDRIDGEMSKIFSISGKGVVPQKGILTHLHFLNTAKKLNDWMASRDLVHGKIEHLLAFGAINPEFQRRHSILALGSVELHGAGGGEKYGVPILSSLSKYAGYDHPEYARETRTLGYHRIWGLDAERWCGGWYYIMLNRIAEE